VGKRYLIDSNTVIDYLDGKLPPTGMSFIDTIVDDTVLVSVITKIEVLGFNVNPSSHKILNDFMEDATVLPLDDDVVKQTINLRKSNKIKTPDAIIAATAIIHNLELVSRDISDFKNIEGLQLINPHVVI